MRQATFLGLPVDPRSLLRESRGATPTRSSSGERAARILAMMDGARTVDELVDALAAAEPNMRRESLLEEVKGCARRYSR